MTVAPVARDCDAFWLQPANGLGLNPREAAPYRAISAFIQSVSRLGVEWHGFTAPRRKHVSWGPWCQTLGENRSVALQIFTRNIGSAKNVVKECKTFKTQTG